MQFLYWNFNMEMIPCAEYQNLINKHGKTFTLNVLYILLYTVIFIWINLCCNVLYASPDILHDVVGTKILQASRIHSFVWGEQCYYMQTNETKTEYFV